MEFHITGRAAGKTHDLVQWARAAPPVERRIIVCHDEREAARVWKEHHVEAISAAAAMRGLWGPTTRFAVDNADLILQRMLRATIVRVTATGTHVCTGRHHSEQVGEGDV